jgi:ssDNA-binding Zn-finger/Zn-ribbon topoisomerase 1
VNNLKYYKRNGYEFQIVQRNGDVCRAVGRKGKSECHEVFLDYDGDIQGRAFWRYDSEKQAVEKFAELVGGICPKCHDQRMIPSDDPGGDVMNTPCPICNENSPDYGKQK